VSLPALLGLFHQALRPESERWKASVSKTKNNHPLKEVFLKKTDQTYLSGYLFFIGCIDRHLGVGAMDSGLG
jgi:hypothetical protein